MLVELTYRNVVIPRHSHNHEWRHPEAKPKDLCIFLWRHGALVAAANEY
jgi:hypothetical protein